MYNRALAKINNLLETYMSITAIRNYQFGSCCVIKSGKVVGLCFEGFTFKELDQLDLNEHDFPDLLDLVIKSSTMNHLPHWVQDLPHVENLILKSLHLPALDLDLSAFTRLNFLVLSGNDIDNIPSYGPLGISRLNLSQNSFGEIPELVLDLPQLVSLMMDHNYVSTAPTIIASTQIQALSMENNQLFQFPEFLQNQLSLYSLDLSKNFMDALPAWISQFSELEYLNLGNNRISELPEGIMDLNNLRMLDLPNNPQLLFPMKILYAMPNLGILNLENSGENNEVSSKIRAFQKMFNRGTVIKI